MHSQKLRKVILEDELGICNELDAFMGNLINTYEDEWAKVVSGWFQSSFNTSHLPMPNNLIPTDPVKRKQFKQFANTDERRPQGEIITERGQQRPADWPKVYPNVKLTQDQFITRKAEWKWSKVATKDDLMPTDSGATSIAVKYGDSQLAVFHVPRRGYYATQQMRVSCTTYGPRKFTDS